MQPAASNPSTTRLTPWSAERVERHREAPLVGAAAPAAADRLELRELGVGELADLPQLGRVPLLLEPRDRLPDLADRPPLERERRGLDDGLVAEVHRAQPE